MRLFKKSTMGAHGARNSGQTVDTEYIVIDCHPVVEVEEKKKESDEPQKFKEQIELLKKQLQEKNDQILALKRALKASRTATTWLQQELATVIVKEPEFVHRG